jgi:hypothetical protein
MRAPTGWIRAGRTRAGGEWPDEEAVTVLKQLDLAGKETGDGRS